MTDEKMSPLRARMMEDMRIRGMGDKAQKSHIRAIKDFAKFIGHSPDTATPEELRAYQLHMTDTGLTPSTFNTRIVALRFFFGITCGREDMKRFMQFRTQPRKLPVVFSYDFDSEPRRFRNLHRRYAPLTYLTDTASPAQMRQTFRDRERGRRSQRMQ